MWEYRINEGEGQGERSNPFFSSAGLKIPSRARKKGKVGGVLGGRRGGAHYAIKEGVVDRRRQKRCLRGE